METLIKSFRASLETLDRIQADELFRQALATRTPIQAVALAQQNHYALILMDMQMPHLNGVDATRAIRADTLNRETPILAMTANAFDEDRQVCLAAGMNDHIAKPVEPNRLFDTLLKWLEG